jgi:hypothetical protein
MLKSSDSFPPNNLPYRVNICLGFEPNKQALFTPDPYQGQPFNVLRPSASSEALNNPTAPGTNCWHDS